MDVLVKNKLQALMTLVISAPFNVEYIKYISKSINISNRLKVNVDTKDLVIMLIDTLLISNDDELNKEIVKLLKILLFECSNIHKLENLLTKLLEMKSYEFITILLKNNNDNVSILLKEQILEHLVDIKYRFTPIAHIAAKNDSVISINLKKKIYDMAVLNLENNDTKNVATSIMAMYRRIIPEFDHNRVAHEFVRYVMSSGIDTGGVNTEMNNLINEYDIDGEICLKILRSITFSTFIKVPNIVKIYEKINNPELIISTLVESKLSPYQLSNLCLALTKLNVEIPLFPLLKLIMDDKSFSESHKTCISHLVVILKKDHYEKMIDYFETIELVDCHIQILNCCYQYMSEDLIIKAWNIIMKNNLHCVYSQSTIIENLISSLNPDFINNEFKKLENGEKLNDTQTTAFVSIYKTFNKEKQEEIFHKLFDKCIDGNKNVDSLLVKILEIENIKSNK